MIYQYTVNIEKDPKAGVFIASVPALGCCFTQGRTREEILERIREAIACHLEALLEDGEEIPHFESRIHE
ncbi:MAG: type II toxin-antitoxin system HicB family antitoxin [Candidatus Omnitrophota bacterium]